MSLKKIILEDETIDLKNRLIEARKVAGSLAFLLEERKKVIINLQKKNNFDKKKIEHLIGEEEKILWVL